MKIIKQTTQQLKISDSISSLLFDLLWGVTFSSLPLVIGWLAMNNSGVTNLNCQRVQSAQVNCHLTSSKLMGLTTAENRVLSGVKGTVLEAKSRENKQKEGKFFLVADQGKVPVKIEQIDARKVNSLIASHQKGLLKIKHDDRLFLVAFIPLAAIFVAINLQHILTLKIYSCDFDLTSKKLVFQGRNIISKDYQEYALEDILDITLTREIDSRGDNLYQAKLILATGDSLPLSSPSIDPIDAQKIVDKVSSFLKPLRDI